jgi:hypothetical protein
MESPPLLSAEPPALLSSKPGFLVSAFAVLLSFCLLLFVADAIVSLVDDCLIVFFQVHLISGVRGLLALASMLMALGVYSLMGLTPLVPKRLFLPIPIFTLVTTLAVFPCMIYAFDRLEVFALVISAGQVAIGAGILYSCCHGRGLAWPLVSVDRLGIRRFSWRNLAIFVFGNVFVVIPLVAICFFFFASTAVNRFSQGFMALRTDGFTVQARKYVRDDGKTIELLPMSHVADAAFYREVFRQIPTNTVVLMEGVTDENDLLTNHISYARLAKLLGVAEQKTTLKPGSNRWVRADVDISQFSKNTIDFLNVVMLVHAKGINPETLLKVTQYSPPPHFEEQLFDDLIRKRNQHLVGEIESRLPNTDHIAVPWGVAHMPGIAGEIQKSGFRLAETRELFVIRFRHLENQGKGAGNTSH